MEKKITKLKLYHQQMKRKRNRLLEEFCGLEKKEENQINPFFGLLADPYFCNAILPAK